jgi:hypothetical protein
MVQESRWPDGETIGARSRQLQGKEHCMPPALTGESCVTWRIADDPAELGHARELVRKTLVAWGSASKQSLLNSS